MKYFISQKQFPITHNMTLSLRGRLYSIKLNLIKISGEDKKGEGVDMKANHSAINASFHFPFWFFLYLDEFRFMMSRQGPSRRSNDSRSRKASLSAPTAYTAAVLGRVQDTNRYKQFSIVCNVSIVFVTVTHRRRHRERTRYKQIQTILLIKRNVSVVFVTVTHGRRHREGTRYKQLL